jgi:sugar phosphate isomerase/epimerase
MPTLLGHTLGTPDLTPFEALDLFAASGLDGAEIIWQDDYRGAIPESDEGSVAAQVRTYADRLGLAIGCLTPYVTEINSLDDETRRHGVARLERAMRTAGTLGCARLRIYGGTLLGDEDEDDVPRLWDRLVASLRHLGSVAADQGLVLCVENHFGTMTVSAAETVALVEEVDSEGVGILYDQANLAFTHREPFEEAVPVQARWIRHVHVKDLEFIHPDRELRTARVASIDKSERIHASRMIGDGILDWRAIVEALVAIGYDGTYSLEYEYRWNPEDLPEPAVGFPESARRLRACFGDPPLRPEGGSAGRAGRG